MLNKFGLVFAVGAMMFTLVADLARADACSCVGPTMRRRIVTPTRNAPRNTVVRVFLTGGFPASLRGSLATEYRLRDPKGRIIALTGTATRTRLDMRPKRGTLAARTRYVIEQVFAFADDGERLTDTERMRVSWSGKRSYSKPRTSMRRAWFAVATFTTGWRARTGKRPATPTITKGRVSFRYGGGDCGPSSSLSVQVTLPKRGMRAGDSLELEVKGRGVVDTIPLLASAAGTTVRAYVSDSRCISDKVSLGYRGPFPVRAAIRSITGVRSRVSKWFKPKIAPLTRPPAKPGFGGIRSAMIYRKAVTAWLGAPMVKRTALKLRQRGPRGCRGGLRVGKRFKLSSKGSADSYEAIGSVAWRRGQGWSVVGDPKGKLANGVRFGRTITKQPLAGSAHGPVGVSDRRGAVVVTTKYGSNNSHLIVGAYDSAGKSQWTHLLVGPKRQSRPRLALGSKLVMVTWWSSRSILHVTMRWALLHRRTGKVVADDGLAPARGPRVGIDVHHGVTYSAGRFFIVYSGYRPYRQRPHVIIVSAKTRKQIANVTLPMAGAGNGFDLAPASKGGVALAYASRRQIYWILLDKNARTVTRPVRLSHALGSRNRKPRIARAGTGAKMLWAVAWEIFPSNTTHVVVIDAKGRKSKPTAIAPGARTSTIAIAPTGSRRTRRTKAPFVVSYVERYGKARAALLLCSQVASLGPPAKIKAITRRP